MSKVCGKGANARGGDGETHLDVVRDDILTPKRCKWVALGIESGESREMLYSNVWRPWEGKQKVSK